MPVRFLAPATAPAVKPVLPPAVSSPEAWRVQGRQAVHSLLSRFMPGPWEEAHVSRIAAQVPSPQRLSFAPADPSFVPHAPTEAGAYRFLRLALSWHLIRSVLDPWAGNGSTRDALRDLVPVYCTDIVQREAPLNALANALEPTDLASLRRLHSPFDGIVASPWFGLLDLALCAALSAPCSFVAFHVPGHYITGAHRTRAAMLQRLSEAQRLLILANLPRSATGRRCAWLIIFATAADRNRLVPVDAQARCMTWMMYSDDG